MNGCVDERLCWRVARSRSLVFRCGLKEGSPTHQPRFFLIFPGCKTPSRRIYIPSWNLAIPIATGFQHYSGTRSYFLKTCSISFIAGIIPAINSWSFQAGRPLFFVESHMESPWFSQQLGGTICLKPSSDLFLDVEWPVKWRLLLVYKAFINAYYRAVRVAFDGVAEKSSCYKLLY